MSLGEGGKKVKYGTQNSKKKWSEISAHPGAYREQEWILFRDNGLGRLEQILNGRKVDDWKGCAGIPRTSTNPTSCTITGTDRRGIVGCLGWVLNRGFVGGLGCCGSKHPKEL
jgi:hypothetical protein